MARAAFLILLAASALALFTAHASRDEEEVPKSEVLVSVGPASFSRISESSSSGAVKEAARVEGSVLAEVHSRPGEEHGHQAAVSSHAKEQPTAASGASSDAASEDHAAAARWKAAAQSTMHQVAKAAAGLTVIGEDSRALRKAVAELGLDVGLEEGELKAAATSKRKSEARAKLQQYAREHHKARQRADALELELKETHARLADTQAESPSESSQDTQFAQLEKDTERVMLMLGEIKRLRAVGKEIQASKDGIMKEAKASGFSADEIEREMKLARLWASRMAETDMANRRVSETSLARQWASRMAETDMANMDTTPEGAADMDMGLPDFSPIGAAELTGKGGASEAGRKWQSTADGEQRLRAEAEQKEQLKNLMASSAIEMAQIEAAANDVVEGMDAFAAWKQKQDDSPASAAEAASVKARLSKAVKFLEEHEHLVEQRSREINALMAKNHMGSLSKLA